MKDKVFESKLKDTLALIGLADIKFKVDFSSNNPSEIGIDSILHALDQLKETKEDALSKELFDKLRLELNVATS